MSVRHGRPSRWGSQCLAKCFFLVVQLDPSKQNYIGAESFNMFVSELSALTWAVIWSAQLCWDIDVSFHYDCKSAAEVINGSACMQCPSNMLEVARVAASIRKSRVL